MVIIKIKTELAEGQSTDNGANDKNKACSFEEVAGGLYFSTNKFYDKSKSDNFLGDFFGKENRDNHEKRCESLRKYVVYEISLKGNIFVEIPSLWVEEEYQLNEDLFKYDGQFSKRADTLEEIVRNAKDLSRGELIVYLLDAIILLKKQDKALEYGMEGNGMEIIEMIKTMDCSISDIVDIEKIIKQVNEI